MADTTKNILVGLLLVTLLVSGVVYITFGDAGLKMRIDEDKSTFYVLEDSRWQVAGREYNLLFDGSSRMYRRASDITLDTTINNVTNTTTIVRTTPFIRGPVVVDTYQFDGTVSDVELFPVSHTVEIYNGSGFFYRYEVRDLVYDGPTEKLFVGSYSFGRKMKVEWQDGFRWAWVYKTGLLKVQYDIPSDYERYEVRLFDPISLLHSFMNTTNVVATDTDILLNVTWSASDILDDAWFSIKFPNRTIINFTMDNIPTGAGTRGNYTAIALNSSGYLEAYVWEAVFTNTVSCYPPTCGADVTWIGGTTNIGALTTFNFRNNWTFTVASNISGANINNMNVYWGGCYTGDLLSDCDGTDGPEMTTDNGTSNVWIRDFDTGEWVKIGNDTNIQSDMYGHEGADYANHTYNRTSGFTSGMINNNNITILFNSTGVSEDFADDVFIITDYIWLDFSVNDTDSTTRSYSYIITDTSKIGLYNITELFVNISTGEEGTDSNASLYFRAGNVPLTIYQDGAIDNRTYEYNTSMNLTIYINATDLGENITLIVSSPYLNNYYNIKSFNSSRNWSMLIPIFGYYSDVFTNTTKALYNWSYNDWYDVLGVEFNITGFSGNTSVIDDAIVYLNSTVNKMLVGVLTDDLVLVTNDFSGGITEDTVIFTTTSTTDTIFLNVSTNTLKNVTFTVVGEPPNVEATDFEELFRNDSLIFNNSNSTDTPLMLIDDLESNIAKWITYGNLDDNGYDGVNDYYYLGDQSTSTTSETTVTGVGGVSAIHVNLNNVYVFGFNVTLYTYATCQTYSNDEATASSIVGIYTTTNIYTGTPRQTVSQEISSVGCSATTERISEDNVNRTVLLKRQSLDSDVWDIYINDAKGSNITLSSANNYFLTNIYTSSFIFGTQTASSAFGNAYIHDVFLGGAGAANEGANDYANNFSVESNVVFNSSYNISSVTLIGTEYDPQGVATFNYYVSVNNGTLWEPIDNGAYMFVDGVGGNLSWKVNATSSSNEYEFGVTSINLVVSDKAPENITFNIGSDNTTEYTLDEVFNITRVISFDDNESASTYFVTYCSGEDSCLLPITVSSDSSGGLIINNLTTVSLLNPIVLGAPFSTSGGINFSQATFAIDDFKATMRGDVDNITIIITPSMGVAIYQTINARYSPFNISGATTYLEFFPSSASSKNVTPSGQSLTVPFWDITPYSRNHTTFIYTNLYEELTACMTLRAANVSNQASFVEMNSSGQKIYSGWGGNNTGIWHYLDLNACTEGGAIDVVINSVCDDCVLTSDFDEWSGVYS